ncbi:hypothetical protein D3C84_473570 [compost metagenome]
MAGLGDQYVLARLQIGQIDQGEISEQQGGVMHAGLQRRQHLRVTGQGIPRHQHQIAPGRVTIGGAGRETGDRRTDLEVVDALTQGFDGAGHLAAHAGRQSGLFGRQVLPPQHIVPAQPYGLDTHQHLARTRCRGRQLFVLQYLGVAEFMQTDHVGHRYLNL